MELLHTTADDFRAHLETPFKIPLNENEATTITLVAVKEHTAHQAPDTGRLPFSLFFQSNHRGFLPQQIWHLHHETLGVLEIFLVPIGPNASGMQYEAVFN